MRELYGSCSTRVTRAPGGVRAVQREGRRERVELREQPPAKPGGTRMAQYVSLVPDCNMVDACPHCTNANQKNVRWSNTYPHVSTQDRYPNRSISCNLTCFSGTLQLLEDNSSWCWCWCWCCCCPAGGPAGACTSSAAAACKAWWRAHGTGGEISSRQLRARSLPAWQEQQHTRRLGPTLVPPCMDVPEVPPQAKESFAVNSPVAVGGWG